RSTDPLTCRRAGISVLSAPRVIDQSRTGGQHLAASMQQWIVQLCTDLNRTLGYSKGPARIEKPIGTDKRIQGRDLSSLQTGSGCANGLRLVSLRTFGHGAKAVVSVPNGFKNFNFQPGSICWAKFCHEGKRVLQDSNCLSVGKPPGQILR